MKIDERIFEIRFHCDLLKCKGACCTVKGTLGAPLKSEEVPLIEKYKVYVRKYLNDENIKVLDRNGAYVKIDDKYWVNNVNDDDCVFSFYEDDIAKCSFQKAFNNKEIDFKKPISCELFPIRTVGNNNDELRYEKSHICDDALVLGNEKNITIYEFVKDAIVREFGENFFAEYKKMKNY